MADEGVWDSDLVGALAKASGLNAVHAAFDSGVQRRVYP